MLFRSYKRHDSAWSGFGSRTGQTAGRPTLCGWPQSALKDAEHASPFFQSALRQCVSRSLHCASISLTTAPTMPRLGALAYSNADAPRFDLRSSPASTREVIAIGRGGEHLTEQTGGRARWLRHMSDKTQDRMLLNLGDGQRVISRAPTSTHQDGKHLCGLLITISCL